MAKLKPGLVRDFSNSMAQEIATAMEKEWLAIKGYPLPSPDGEEDRRILFVAIARGVLQYLWEHRADIGTTAVTTDGTGSHSHTLEFEIDQSEEGSIP